MFNNVLELKSWISDYIENKGKRSLHIAINNSKGIKEDIKAHTDFLPEEIGFNQRCYHILNDIKEIPVCKYCGIEKVNFNNRDKKWGYLDYCSSKCGRLNSKSQLKYKETSLKKYGVDNFSKTKVFKDKMNDLNISKYGVKWYQQSEDFRQKSIKTCLEKYGFTSYTKTEEFKLKIRESFMLNWGVDWYTKSQDFRDKFKKTCMERYGVEHFMFDDDISNLFKKQYKDYKLPSGKIVRIQGYENFALDILLKKYNEDDLLISNKEIRNEIGIINYIIDDSQKIYIPDIYIKSENKIIEVKSQFTYDSELEKNKIKKESCIDMGIDFEFWIIDKSGNIKNCL